MKNEKINKEKGEKYEEAGSRSSARCGGGEERSVVAFEARSSIFDNRFAREPMASPNEVVWLRTDEAAQYLRVSISSLKTMIYLGKVRPHKLGRLNRFLKHELERLITLPKNN